MDIKRLLIVLFGILFILSCNSQKTDTHDTSPAKDTPADIPKPEKPSPELPDLIIISGSRTPGGMVAPGTQCTFKIQVRNIGQGNYTHSIVVGGPASGGFNGLASGETKDATIYFTAYSPGATYNLTFTVDPDDVIKESNESNNKSHQFTIQTTN